MSSQFLFHEAADRRVSNEHAEHMKQVDDVSVKCFTACCAAPMCQKTIEQAANNGPETEMQQEMEQVKLNQQATDV